LFPGLDRGGFRNKGLEHMGGKNHFIARIHRGGGGVQIVQGKKKKGPCGWEEKTFKKKRAYLRGLKKNFRGVRSIRGVGLVKSLLSWKVTTNFLSRRVSPGEKKDNNPNCKKSPKEKKKVFEAPVN